MSELTAKSRYERLGGVDEIATVVDDFIDRIAFDLRLNADWVYAYSIEGA